jgi:hypothetical protein
MSRDIVQVVLSARNEIARDRPSIVSAESKQPRIGLQHRIWNVIEACRPVSSPKGAPVVSTSTPTQAPQSPEANLRETLRFELEATRTLYLELAASANESNWNNRSGNPAWTVGQVLGHIVLIFQAIPTKIGRVRRGKGLPKPPDFLFNPLNVWSTRLATRKFRPDNVVEAYEEAHKAALAALDDVKDDEWSLAASFFGQHQDIPEFFHYHARHVREHEPDIRAGTGTS